MSPAPSWDDGAGFSFVLRGASAFYGPPSRGDEADRFKKGRGNGTFKGSA